MDSVTPLRSRGRLKHPQFVWGVIIVLSFGALAGTYFFFVDPPSPRSITIATGGTDGAYYHFAQQYAELLQADGIKMEVRATKGSLENLQLLQDSSSHVALALVQSGVANAQDCENLQSLGSLYREPLWIFVRGADKLDRLSSLAGKRLAIGPPGSGTRAVALQLLKDNRIVPGGPTILEDSTGLAAADALRAGKVDAAFFVAGVDVPYIHALLEDDGVRLLDIAQQAAYLKRFRFLSGVSLPPGLIDLARNVPASEVNLVAPTAMLVARKDLSPALVSLLMATAARVHGKGDLLSAPDEFPSQAYVDIPLGEDARRYYKTGPPLLQRVLPFWLASATDRLKVMVIPLVMLLMPLFRAAPPLVRWRTRRKVYLWYSVLRDIDDKLVQGPTMEQSKQELKRLQEIERQVASHVDVPLSYMEEFYNLRLHIATMAQKLEKSIAAAETTPAHVSDF